MFPENVSRNFDRVRQIAFSDLPIKEKMHLFDSFDEVEVLFKCNIKYARNCFLPIAGFEEYAVSPFGDVISSKYGSLRLLSQGIDDTTGYLKVTLCRNGKMYTRKVHKLVADTFLPNPEQKPQVNHVDCDKKNNRLDNLEFCTREENMRHAFRNGLYSKRGKLTEDELDEIVDMLNSGATYNKIAERFGISHNRVLCIATGKAHKEIYKDIKVPESKIYKNKYKIKVKCLENGKTYESQKEAAIDLSISDGNISQHLHGKLSHVGGYTFERIEEKET